MRYGQLRHVFGSTRGFETLVSGNMVELLHDGDQVFPAMLEAIAGAREEILLEMYWFGSDRIGRRFADALIERARAGVQVRVLYDAVGSLDSDGSMFDELRGAGCEVVEFNPIAPWRTQFRLGMVNNRNHRKMLIVDRRIGFTGGVNIGDPWAPESEGGEGWRDDMVRIEGRAVRQMHAIFGFTWSRLVGGGDSSWFLAPSSPDAESSPRAAESPVQVLANHYFGERRAIRRAYLDRIRAARRCVYITNSYFVPDRAIRRALTQAAERGVDVRVILPGESDVPAVYYAGRNLYTRLLEAGIRLHEWQGALLHAKTAVIDGVWCTVGTYNLDYRSWRVNLEVTAVIEDSVVAGAMEARFQRDLTQTQTIELRQFRYRSLMERFLEKFFYMFRKLL